MRQLELKYESDWPKQAFLEEMRYFYLKTGVKEHPEKFLIKNIKSNLHFYVENTSYKLHAY